MCYLLPHASYTCAGRYLHTHTHTHKCAHRQNTFRSDRDKVNYKISVLILGPWMLYFHTCTHTHTHTHRACKNCKVLTQKTANNLEQSVVVLMNKNSDKDIIIKTDDSHLPLLSHVVINCATDMHCSLTHTRTHTHTCTQVYTRSRNKTPLTPVNNCKQTIFILDY